MPIMHLNREDLGLKVALEAKVENAAKEEPLVSVVVLNCNGVTYLKRTIFALQRLTYPNVEIVVVDNGSSDESVPYLNTIEGLTLICNPVNLGYSKGKNIGVEAAGGEYVLLLDEDILLDDESIIDKLLAGMTENILAISLLLVNAGSTVTKYYGGYYTFYGLLHRRDIDYQQILAFPSSLVPIGSPDGGALFFRRQDFLSTGGYDTSQAYFLDVGDWGIRGALLTGKRNMLFTKSVAWHLGQKRKEDIQTWCWKFSFSFCGQFKILVKNFRIFNILTMMPFVFSYQVLVAAKNLIVKKDWKIIQALIKSIIRAMADFAGTLKKRGEIQRHRQSFHDFFLHIKPPF